MPKRLLALTDQASVMLDQLKNDHPQKSLGQIASEAIVNYALIQNANHAETVIERLIDQRFQKMENGLRSLVAANGITINMVLYDVLEQRLAYAREDKPNVDPKAIHAELRQRGIELFNSIRSMKVQLAPGEDKE